MIIFRKAQDNDDVADMLYQSSPELFNFVLGFKDHKIRDFLAYDFARGKGIFGYRSLYVAEYDKEVVGTLTAYSGKDYFRLVTSTAVSCLRYYGLWRFLLVMKRSLIVAPLFIRPSREGIYIANGHVSPQRRLPGVFAALVDCSEKLAQERGLKFVECDVNFKNDRSLKVHQSFGFKIIHERPYQGRDPLLDGVRRLRLDLQDETPPALI